MSPIKQLIALLEQQYDKPDGYKSYTELLNRKRIADYSIEWDLWCLVAHFSTKKDLSGINPEFLMAIGESFYTAALVGPEEYWKPGQALVGEIYPMKPFPGIPSISQRKINDVQMVLDKDNLIGQLKKLASQESTKLEALFALVSLQEVQPSAIVLTQEELLSYQTNLSAALGSSNDQPKAFALKKHVLASINYFLEKQNDSNFSTDLNTHSYIVSKFSDAIDWYFPAAKNGDPWAQFMVGYCLIDKEPPNSITWFKKAAVQGHIRSQTRVGELKESLEELTNWHSKAAMQGSAQSMFKLGRFASAHQMEFFRRAGAQGHVMAQFELAVRFLEQRKVTAAFPILNELAATNDDAKFLIGAIHYEGVDICYKDPASAVHWFNLAANNNHAKAQLYLARCHRDGVGTVRDLKSAISWYEKASVKLIDALTELGKIYLSDEEKNPKLAFHYLEQTKKGVQPIEALYLLATCYEKAIGTEKNLPEAINCYEKIIDRQADPAEAREALSRLRSAREVDETPVRTLGM